MRESPGGIIVPDALYDELVGRSRPSPLRGQVPPQTDLDVPRHMRLYGDTGRLLWTSNELLGRQREFATRSPLVHLLLEQLQLVIDFACHHDGQPSGYKVVDLTFTLDATAPIKDNSRKYKFDCTWPLRGKVDVEERLEYGQHTWRYYMEIQGKTFSIRDVSEGVDKFAGTERKLSNGRSVRVTEEFERQLDI